MNIICIPADTFASHQNKKYTFGSRLCSCGFTHSQYLRIASHQTFNAWTLFLSYPGNWELIPSCWSNISAFLCGSRLLALQSKVKSLLTSFYSFAIFRRFAGHFVSNIASELHGRLKGMLPCATRRRNVLSTLRKAFISMKFIYRPLSTFHFFVWKHFIVVFLCGRMNEWWMWLCVPAYIYIDSC